MSLARPVPRFTLDPRRGVRSLVFVLVCLEILVVLLDLWLYGARAVRSEDLRALFNATSERGLGSWLAVTQATLIALTLWGLAGAHRKLGAPRLRTAGWTALAVFFTYLALDDANQIHERIGSAFADSEAAEVGLGAAFPSYYWQLVLGPFFAVAALGIGVFLWRELRTARLKLGIGVAFALLGLAVGMDFVDGLDPSHPLNVNARLAMTEGLHLHTQRLFGMSAFEAVTHFSRSLEECIEMVAMTLLWAVFLRHAAYTVGGVHLEWSPAPAVPAQRPAFVHAASAAPKSGLALPRPGHGTSSRSAPIGPVRSIRRV